MNHHKPDRRSVIKTLGLATVASALPTIDIFPKDANTVTKSKLDAVQQKTSKPVTVIVIGAGQRGWGAYSQYGIHFPDRLQVVGVAEPIPHRRERMSKAFNIPEENQFVTWEDVFKRPKFADALFITTPDDLHYGPAMAGLQMGYHLLLEKVIAQSWKECNDILRLTDGFTAPGLEEVKKHLQYDKLSEQEKRDYLHHVKQRLYEQNSIDTATMKGEAKGLKKGEAIGRTAEKENVVINSHYAKLPVETISIIAELTVEQVVDILKRRGLA